MDLSEKSQIKSTAMISYENIIDLPPILCRLKLISNL